VLGFDVHKNEKLAYYSKACTDITFKYRFGIQKLEGIAARECFDLTQDQNHGRQSMEYFDENTQRKSIPHVIEPEGGVDRKLLAVVCSACHEEEVDGELCLV
jgi:glycyl-tRNA synthetase